LAHALRYFSPTGWRERLARWLFRTGGPAAHDVVLIQRRVFILPTRQGLVFGGVLLLMLTGSVNYNLSLGYVLTFLLGAMGFNAMLHTYRNLAQLKVTAAQSPAVFAGERARFTVNVGNPQRRARHAVGLTRDRLHADYVDVPGGGAALATVSMEAPRRGILRPGRLVLFTHYPLGLYRAWSYLELDLQCIVYPRPAPPGMALPRSASARQGGEMQGTGEDDFAGLRSYHPGDAPRRIAWKASARESALLTKQFSGRAAAECWLEWNALPPRLGVEDKLSRLARWILDAHAAGIAYGLRLPARTIAIASGEAHRARCLEALALFELDDERDERYAQA
jgi:uncharacterized protein (DUF58 family)